MSLQYQLIEQTESTGEPTQQLMQVMAFLSLSVLCLASLSTVGYIVPGDLPATGCGEYGARCSRALYIVTTDLPYSLPECSVSLSLVHGHLSTLCVTPPPHSLFSPPSLSLSPSPLSFPLSPCSVSMSSVSMSSVSQVAHDLTYSLIPYILRCSSSLCFHTTPSDTLSPIKFK